MRLAAALLGAAARALTGGAVMSENGELVHQRVSFRVRNQEPKRSPKPARQVHHGEKKLVHRAARFGTPILIGKRARIQLWVHQVGGPPLVPEKTNRSLIYNGFLELVASPPQATSVYAPQRPIWVLGRFYNSGYFSTIPRESNDGLDLSALHYNGNPPKT